MTRRSKLPRRIPKLMAIACFGSSLFVPSIQVAHSNQAMIAAQESHQFFPGVPGEQLLEQTRSITVKIISEEVVGSGFIIKRQDSVYTVVTNAHVLKAGQLPYQVQTLDGLLYRATPFNTVFFHDRDLALLQFKSTKNVYNVASLGKLPKIEEEIYAAGFPFSGDQQKSQGFVFRVGRVTRILDKELQGGYQIGYTSWVEKGMSGGPVMNAQGQVVAINGIHAEPLWGSPYAFSDGSLPEPALKDELSQYNWGIPSGILYSVGLPVSAKTLQ